MKRVVSLAFALSAAVLLATPLHAQDKASGQAEFAVDKAKAKSGSTVWAGKQCVACHTIGKGKMAGPDLAGLLDRRSEEWVRTWLKDPNAMFETDETAKAMLAEWKGVKMPNMKLTPEQIENVLHYIVEQGQKAKK